MLSDHQYKLLSFIHTYTRDNGGVSPTFSKMKQALGLRSKSTIYDTLSLLQNLGFLRRTPHRACAITLLRPFPIRYKIFVFDDEEKVLCYARKIAV